ncbi:MAG: hypothetical protein ABSH16_02575 [Sedimentisphaerales bacterium]
MADSEVTELSKTMSQVPKSILTILNQLYELEQKIKKYGDPSNFSRNVSKMKDALAEEGFPVLDASTGQHRIGLAYEDPMGQSVNETRTDLEFQISGEGTENLVVVEVIKPIIRVILSDSTGKFSQVAQKGIVIVESRKEL